MTSRPKWMAYAQLMRLPNVFTAIADPLAGWFVVGGDYPAWHCAALAGSSACLYTAGVVLNDYFDFELDARDRPNRPLPHGDIFRSTAGVFGGALMVAGLELAVLVSLPALCIAGIIAALVLLYNTVAKKVPILGPLVLGVCRTANFCLGMGVVALPKQWWMPATLGVYVIVLSLVARREVEVPTRKALVKCLLLGIIVLDAGFVALANQGLAAGLLLTLLVPAIVLSRQLEMT